MFIKIRGLPFKCVDKTQFVTIEQYFHVVLFILLYKMVVTFQSVDETPVCGYYPAVPSCDTANYIGCTRWLQLSLEEILVCGHFNESYSLN